MTLREYFKTIADAIRAKSKSSATIKASNLASTIRGFLNFKEAKSVTGNGNLRCFATYFENGRDISYTATCSYYVKGIAVADPGHLYFYVDCKVSGPGGTKTNTVRACLSINN